MIEALLNGKYNDVLDELFITEKDDYLRLHSIILKDGVKQSGYGTQIMSDIVKYADDNNKIVTLTASDSYGSNKGRLIKFYKRFGFVPNKGRNKDYRFQDTMIRTPKTMNEDKIKGGKADDMSLADIAKYHGISVDDIKKGYEIGVSIESEHLNSKDGAKEIAKDHLYEDPHYYTTPKPKNWGAKELENELDEVSAFPIIKRKLQEAISKIAIGDKTNKGTVYIIFDGDRALGGIEISNVSGSPSDDKATILNISGDKNERPIKVIRDAIPMLFRVVPTMNTLFVPTNEHNRSFWERAGANEVQRGLHAFQRGH
jgi:hypothetical protein